MASILVSNSSAWQIFRTVPKNLQRRVNSLLGQSSAENLKLLLALPRLHFRRDTIVLYPTGSVKHMHGIFLPDGGSALRHVMRPACIHGTLNFALPPQAKVVPAEIEVKWMHFRLECSGIVYAALEILKLESGHGMPCLASSASMQSRALHAVNCSFRSLASTNDKIVKMKLDSSAIV